MTIEELRKLTGKRLLLKEKKSSLSTLDYFEIVILEVSDGGRIKIEYPTGSVYWKDADDVFKENPIVEVLKELEDNGYDTRN